MFEMLGCPILVELSQMQAVVRTESAGHVYAVGIVGHLLNRQPQSKAEAIALVRGLENLGLNYSVGIAQVNKSNFGKYGLNESNFFELCPNLWAGSAILHSCYLRYGDWSKAYSCYYSGNALTGFRHGYVAKVLSNA
ncbi:MAG: lytic transglycosylase domain-containing protein, partial [Campylobacter sp.]|nr:lytic transglycosylase domain-containing protein [Campylobacter sp.]